MSNEEELLASLRALVGSHGTPQSARNPVNQPAIDTWCDAMGMDNPRYANPAGAIAPAAMLSTWTMAGKVPLPDDPQCPRTKAFALLREQGFSGIIGTTFDEEYLRPLRPGELLNGTLFLTDVSERKKTGLGEGYFLTTRTEYTNQAGEPAGSWALRILTFQPRPRKEGAGQAAPAAGPKPEPKVAPIPPAPQQSLKTKHFAEVAVGEELPPWTIAVTRQLVIAGATATGDFTDIHHDTAAAKRAGLPDIFMNALTSSGLCSRYAEGWAGPEVEQKNIRLRLGMPCVAGERLTFSATVAAKEAKGSRGLITLNLVGRIAAGDHLTGTLALELPT